MIVSQIAAMDKNRVIGNGLKMSWDLPEDLKFFRTKTKGHIIIQGRKTFESLGNKPLPHRLNIILTRDPSKVVPHPEIVIFTDIKEALTFAESKIGEYPDEVFITGGEEIYRLALPYTDKIYLTEIDMAFKGNIYFPTFDKKVFREVERIPRTEPFPFAFVTYERTEESDQE